MVADVRAAVQSKAGSGRADAVLESLAARLDAATRAVDGTRGTLRPDGLPSASGGQGFVSEGQERRGEPCAPDVTASTLLADLVLRSRLAEDIAWLTLVAVLGRFPSTQETSQFLWDIAVERPEVAASRLLERAARCGEPSCGSITVVTDAVVVEADFCAQHDVHTGIMRVVRETVPRWAAEHALVPVAWTGGPMMRSLSRSEQARLLRYGSHEAVADEGDWEPSLIVPFRTVVLFPDVAVFHQAGAVSALARYSGNEVGWLGYDLIPILSADLRPEVEVGNPAVTFSAIKYSTRVAGISQSAAAEYAGLVSALAAQGIPGPTVRGVTLPAVGAPLPSGPDARRESRRPVLLIVGSRERQKNVRSAFHAAERLWSEGLDFELRHLGPGGWDDEEFSAVSARLAARNRPLTVLGRVSEQRLWDELRAADAVVFISVHEGYGLPVAEALSVGTPVVTTGYGSQAEIAADGGCLLVDPRDDDSIVDAMRRIVTDRELRERLAQEARNRPVRTWDDYAAETWAFLVDGVDPIADVPGLVDAAEEGAR